MADGNPDEGQEPGTFQTAISKGFHETNDFGQGLHVDVPDVQKVQRSRQNSIRGLQDGKDMPETKEQTGISESDSTKEQTGISESDSATNIKADGAKFLRLAPICTGCAVVLVLFAILVQTSILSSTTSLGVMKPKPMTWNEAEDKFNSYLTKLMKTYRNQVPETFIQISSSVSSTLQKETPRQPSPLVFLTPPTMQSSFGSCLARVIGEKVNAVFQNLKGLGYTPEVLELGPAYLNDQTISTTDIHNKLKKYLEKGKFVVISNPELVEDRERIMIFHAFCDNSAAPEKRATFIFLMSVPESIYRKYEWLPESGAKIANEILDSAWSSVDPDKRPATIARVAASAILLNPGDTCQ